MAESFQFARSTTITGVIIFMLGMFTFTPEIFLSGIVVMAVSAAQHLQFFETQRMQGALPAPSLVPQPVQQPVQENQSFYSW